MADNLALGDDFGGSVDIDPSFSVVTGRRALAEAVARGWLDLAGSIFYAPDRGVGVSAFLSAAVNTNGLAHRLEEDALKDERVQDCSVTVTLVAEQLKITGALTDAQGPFTLTVLVSQLSTQVLLQGVA